MSDEIKDNAPIDLSRPSIGGKKVGNWTPVNLGKEIDFSSIPGVRCVMPPEAHPLNRRAKTVKSGEPEESKDVTLREQDQAI